MAAGVCAWVVASAAAASPVLFADTGGTVDYVIPADGRYRIVAVGARGGDAPRDGGAGGLGAEAGGTFGLARGETVRVLVGAAGADGVVVSPYFVGFGGGGGGSFVAGPDGRPLVIAGGGGGGGRLNASYPSDLQPAPGGPRYGGADALTGPDGGAAPLAGGAGGTGGTDGEGGLLPAIALPSRVNAGRGFGAFPFASAPGASGGGGLADDAAGAGGGGGYSGGGGGGPADYFGTFRYGVGGGGGGGGGSFTAGGDPVLLARVGIGDGWVTITPLGTVGVVAIPEPAGFAPFGVGLALLVSSASLREMVARRPFASHRRRGRHEAAGMVPIAGRSPRDPAACARPGRAAPPDVTCPVWRRQTRS